MWEKIKAFFSDSETIAYARLQAFVGVVAAVLQGFDYTILVGLPKWLAYALLANGVVTEVLRRRRATDL